MAPAGTPPSVINRIALAVKDAVALPDTISKLGQMGVDPIGDTPAQFLDALKADLAVWSEAAKASNLKME